MSLSKWWHTLNVLCDYSDVYIPVSGTIEIQNTEIATAQNNRKIIIIKKCT